MADEKKAVAVVEESATAPPVRGGKHLKQHKLVDLDDSVRHVYVPLTSQNYDVEEMTDDQAAQLLAMGWPHVSGTKK